MCPMGNQLLPQKKGHSHHPIFGPCLLWPNGWMDRDATCYGGKPRPRRRCVKWGRAPPPMKGAQQPPPLFGPCLLWPWSPIPATAELLYSICCQFLSHIVLYVCCYGLHLSDLIKKTTYLLTLLKSLLFEPNENTQRLTD